MRARLICMMRSGAARESSGRENVLNNVQQNRRVAGGLKGNSVHICRHVSRPTKYVKGTSWRGNCTLHAANSTEMTRLGAPRKIILEALHLVDNLNITTAVS